MRRTPARSPSVLVLFAPFCIALVAAPSGLFGQSHSSSTEAGKASLEIQRLGAYLLDWWIERAGEDAFASQQSLDLVRVDASSLPILSRREILAAISASSEHHADPNELLVDPWGNQYEVRVALPGSETPGGVLVRSAGADGEWEGSVYELGSADDENSDLVWLDGFFVRFAR